MGLSLHYVLVCGESSLKLWLIEGTVLSFLLLLSLAGTILSLLSHSTCVHNSTYLPIEKPLLHYCLLDSYILYKLIVPTCFEKETSLFF